MTAWLSHLRVHRFLALATTTGVLVAWLVPGGHSAVTRGLLGWNAAVWLYLGLVSWMMFRADQGRVQRVAAAQAESAGTVLLIVALAATVSLVGVVAELSAVKAAGGTQAWPHLVLALSTVVGSWALLPIVFALTYASLYYQAEQRGLKFPGDEPDFAPHYVDFLYFSFTLAVALQTSDVSVSTTAMRRTVLLHTLLAFAFNTAVLAFSINMAASLF